MSPDYQKSRVYAWEQTELHDLGLVPRERAQDLVNFIWTSEGLVYPPSVIDIHVNTKKWAGWANRCEIALQPMVSTKTIIHEVAHSMCATVDGDSNGHGPWWMGVYMKLLEKHMKIPLSVLMYTADRDGIDFNITAYPIFLDD